jgi:peptidoglycan hydrolase-like protein with peptidoglycan-binding domain
MTVYDGRMLSSNGRSIAAAVFVLVLAVSAVVHADTAPTAAQLLLQALASPTPTAPYTSNVASTSPSGPQESVAASVPIGVSLPNLLPLNGSLVPQESIVPGATATTTASSDLLQTLEAEVASLEEELATMLSAMATSTPTSTARLSRPLALGSTGADVTALQTLFAQQGLFATTPSGYYGPVTEAAVAAFQSKNGLDPVGSVGPKTRAILNKLLSSSPSSSSIGAGPSTTQSSATSSQSAIPIGITLTSPGYGGGGSASGGSGGGGGGGGGPTPDITPLSVSLTAPTASSTVGGSSITLAATASEGGGTIASVQFEVDGANIGAAVSSSPYTTTWNSTSTTDGSHTLYAVAEDTSGNFATSSETVTVENPPVISAISFASSATTNVIVTWTTNEPATSQINYGSTISYGSASSSAAFVTSHTMTLTGLTASTTYHFQIQSVDSQGNTATSSDQIIATPFLSMGVVDMTSSNSSIIPAGGDPTIVDAFAPGWLDTNITFPASGYYTITVMTMASQVSTPWVYDIYVDKHPVDHGYDPISNSYYMNAITSFNGGSAPNYTFTPQSVTSYITAGTHNVGIDYFGGDHTLFGNMLVSTATGPTLLSEPAGTRDPTVQPFSSYSIWNTAIGSGATWSGSILCNRDGNGVAIPDSVPGCDPVTTDLTRETAAINSADWSLPFYIASSSDPLQTFHDQSGFYPDLVTNAPSDMTPDLPTVADGGDAHLNLFDQDKEMLYSFDGCASTSDPVGWTCKSETQENVCELGDNTSGWGIGAIRTSEIQAGLIPHMLRFAIPTTLIAPGTSVVQGVAWPSVSAFDSCGYPGGCYTGNVPTGATIGIPASVNINTLGLTPDGLVLARALQDYGALERDTGGGGGITLFTETSASQNATTAAQVANMNNDLNNIIRPLLRVMTDQGPNSINGGGTPRQPLAPGIDPSICPLPVAPRS